MKNILFVCRWIQGVLVSGCFGLSLVACNNVVDYSNVDFKDCVQFERVYFWEDNITKIKTQFKVSDAMYDSDHNLEITFPPRSSLKVTMQHKFTEKGRLLFESLHSSEEEAVMAKEIFLELGNAYNYICLHSYSSYSLVVDRVISMTNLDFKNAIRDIITNNIDLKDRVEFLNWLNSYFTGLGLV